MKHRLERLFAAAACAAVLLAGSREAGAQVTPAAGYKPPDDTPKVSIGGVIFADYTTQSQPTGKDADGNTIHQSSFNVGRTYLNVTGNISHLISFRITPDISRESGSGSSLNGSYTFRLKYGFGQINLDQWMGKGAFVRIGLQQTPYIDYAEGVYRYRFQGPTFTDREGFVTSSDLGIGAHFDLPANYGDVQFGVFNGEGYTKPEANDQKAFEIRATVRPAPRVPVLKGLRVTGFYWADHYVAGAKRDRFVGHLIFEHPFVNAGFEYLDAKDQTSVSKPEVHAHGWSAFVTPRTPIGVEALLRYEELKPNKDFGGQKKKRFIGGIAYWFPVTKGGIAAALLADYENVKYDDFPAGSPNAKPEEKRYALHTLFSF